MSASVRYGRPAMLMGWSQPARIQRQPVVALRPICFSHADNAINFVVAVTGVATGCTRPQYNQRTLKVRDQRESDSKKHPASSESRPATSKSAGLNAVS